MPTPPRFYPIGTPGQPWGSTEISAWRARQRRQRSYADDVLREVLRPRAGLVCTRHGEITYGNERYPVHALASSDWRAGRPTLLVTGGVHGYETSGVLGALAFADARGEIIKSAMVAPGVIRYRLREWGLCTSVSGAPLTCTTEVYPDSPRTTPAECVAAQVTAVNAVLEFILTH